jgi:lipid-A-disaccharide synthase
VPTLAACRENQVAMADPELLIVAGEASGDLHAGRLLAELRREVPGVRAFGMGGAELRAAGLEAVADSGEVSVVGLFEALRVLPRARRVYQRLLAAVDRRRPTAALLVDFPEFNLRLARALKGRGVRVVYYVSPQVWAWRRGRVRTIARLVDRMLVLFPFEAAFYRQHGVAAVHVGHPLVDEVPVRRQAWEDGAPGDGPYRLALLPGSRESEVRALLPTMLAATRRLAAELPLQATLVQAPTVSRAILDEQLALAGVPASVVARDRFDAVAASHLALCASGTATLEVGLLGTPLIVLYRLRLATWWLARLMVKLPYVSLVNLVLGRGVVPELLQTQATPQRIAREAAALLRDPARIDAMRAALGELRGRLGEGGASRRAAAQVAALLRPVLGAPA